MKTEEIVVPKKKKTAFEDYLSANTSVPSQ